MKLVNNIIFLIILIEVDSQNDVSEVDFDQFDEEPLFNGEIPIEFDRTDEIFQEVPTVNNFLDDANSGRLDELIEDENLRVAKADPTLHKWKQKRPLIPDQPYIKTHFTDQSYSFIPPAIVHPAKHISSQTHIHNIPKKQFVVLEGHGTETFQGHHMDNKKWNQGVQYSESQPYASLHQDSYVITDQNNHHYSQPSVQVNQNNQWNHFHSSGNPLHNPYSSKPEIVNQNGHSNSFIQSGSSNNLHNSQVSSHNNQVSSHSSQVSSHKSQISSHINQVYSHNSQVFPKVKAASSPAEDHIIGIRMPVEEEIYWEKSPEDQDSQINHSELINPDVYDAKMNNILDILDERSYDRERPEVQYSSVQKHAEDFKQGDQNIYNEFQPETEPPGFVDYNLKSPNLIRVPFNNYFHNYNYNRNSRGRRSPGNINMNLLSNNSMFFNISTWKLKEINSKLDDTLQDYTNLVDSYRKKLTDKRETLFTDVLDSMIDQFHIRDYKNTNDIKKIRKRSATITKLLNNPDVRLDVPKTLDNIGTITRNAFEDQRSPMFHVRKFLGSTKNAVLSAMKIPPQNLVIPSNYEIKNINPEEIEEEEDNMVSGINPKILSRSSFKNSDSGEESENEYSSDPYGIVETFARIGGAIRDSVRSGQNTLTHISDVAHNARKIYQTTKNSVPRILLPYAKAPVLLSSRFKETKKAPLNKAIIISPKVLDVKDSYTGSRSSEPDFVSMGHILDAIGLTKPNKDQIDLEKIVVKMPGQGETRGLYIPPIGDVKSVNGRMLPSYRNKVQMKQKSVEKLGSKQDKIASTNSAVKENIEKMKNNISKTIDEAKFKLKSDTLQMKQRNNIEKSLSNSSPRNISSKKDVEHFSKQEEDEIIDKFLYNIFKIDSKNKAKYEPLLSLNKISGNKKKNDKIDEEFTLGLPNIKSPPNITKADFEETIKNITLDLLKDENEIAKYTRKNMKTNRIPKLSNKKKIEPKTIPKFVLKSRFGDDEESDNENTTTDSLELPEYDDEAMRKVDEYVLNDVSSPMFSHSSKEENRGSSWKIGNVLELVEDPSAEKTSKEVETSVNENNEVPVFSSRNLLWHDEETDERNAFALDKENLDHEEKVGLNLPPELMTPFMARSSEANIDRIFSNEGKIAHTEKNTEKENLKNETYSEENNGEEDVLGLNLPPELMKPFMARNSNANIDETFVSDEKVDKPNVLNDNDEMQYYLPLLMMPHRTTKSVKKTLDEFLKKENATKHQKWNIRDHRFKQSEDHSDENERHEHIFIKPYNFPRSEFMRKMGFNFPNSQNCKTKKCFETPSYNEEDPQRFIVCVCIPEDDDHQYYDLPNRIAVDLVKPYDSKKGIGQSRTSMDVSESLKTPFMGLGNDESIKKFYDEYNMKQENEGLFGSKEEHDLFTDD